MMGQYLLQLLTGSILCAGILCLVQQKSCETVIRSLCGLFLTLLLLEPLGEMVWEPDRDFLQDAAFEADAYRDYGTAMARREQAERISEALEAYILDKAAREDVFLTVDVRVGEDLLPAGAELRGDCDDRIRQTLADMIEKELGIAKENQWWTG